MTTKESLIRVVALVTNVLCFALAAHVIVALMLQLAWGVGVITLGPESSMGPAMYTARTYPGPLPLGPPAAAIVAGTLLVSALRNRDSDAWRLRTAVTPIPIIGMLAFEMLTYRLIGLFALCVGTWAYVHYARGRGRLGILVYACLAMLLSGVLPFDISLQNVPGHPRWLPTAAGLPSRETAEAAKRGELVVVGGCVPEITEPSWVWVW